MGYFTPLTGVGGGALIGTSAAILLLLSGDILGASGIFSTALLSPQKAITEPSSSWRLVFLSSFILISNTLLGAHFSYDKRLVYDASIPIVSLYGYLIAGFLSGFGTRLGNGCTSGHGICGMARLSKRSIVAVCTFMVTGFATATVTSPDMPFSNLTDFLRTNNVPNFYNRWLGLVISLFFVSLALYAIYNILKEKGKVVSNQDIEQQSPGNKDAQKELQLDENANAIHITESINKLIPAVIGGILFAIGLAVSQMVLQSKVFGFLNLYLLVVGSYDPTLLTVMVGGCLVSWVSYQFVKPFSLIPNPHARECPILGNKFNITTNTVIDIQLIVGAFCFGIGWGLGGLCPGPALFLAACGSKSVLCYWWPTFIVGSFLAEKMKAKLDPMSL